MSRFSPVIALGVALALTGLTTPVHAQESELGARREAARQAPRDADAQRALAETLLLAGRFREAETAFQRASRLTRSSPEALYDVARPAFAEGDYRRARRHCAALVRAARGTPIAQVCEARAFLAWNRSARAFELLEEALGQDSDHYEGWLALGDAHRLRAAVEESESAYRRAAALEPRAAAPHLGLGQLYAAAGREESAREALTAALERAPAHPEVLYELGRLAPGARGPELLRRAVAGRSAYPEAQQALGERLLDAGEPGEAAEAFRAALRQSPRLVGAQAGLGRALSAAGQLDEAESTLRRALEQVPNDATSALALADVFARTNRQEEAYEQYRRASDLDPSDPDPLLAAARLALEQDRPVLATGYLDRVLRAHPNHATALALYGDIMRARRQVDRARDFYQRALSGAGELDRGAVQRALRELR